MSGVDAVLWSNSGLPTILPDAAGLRSYANAINRSEEIVGWSNTATGSGPVLWPKLGTSYNSTVLQDAAASATAKPTLSTPTDSIGYSATATFSADAALWSPPGTNGPGYTMHHDGGGQGDSYVKAINASEQSVIRQKSKSTGSYYSTPLLSPPGGSGTYQSEASEMLEAEQIVAAFREKQAKARDVVIRCDSQKIIFVLSAIT
jgi:hypothetical protein